MLVCIEHEKSFIASRPAFLATWLGAHILMCQGSWGAAKRQCLVKHANKCLQFLPSSESDLVRLNWSCFIIKVTRKTNILFKTTSHD